EQLKTQMADNAVMRTNQDNVLRSISSAIISLDANGRVLLFNRMAEDVFGIQADYARQRPLEELVPANLRHTLNALAVGHEAEQEVRMSSRSRFVCRTAA